MDARTADVLQRVLRREGRSIVQYVGNAFPWTTADRTEALDRLREIIGAEREAIVRLGRFLYRHHAVPPPPPSYPVSFTTLNFVGLDLILRRLAEYERQSLAALAADLAPVADPEARLLLESFRDLKARNLEALGKLQARAPQPMVTE
jgi:hypothetical protein